MTAFITNHWVEISGVIALVILLAERIARLTPTETDDGIVKRLRAIARVLSIDVRDNPGKGGRSRTPDLEG